MLDPPPVIMARKLSIYSYSCMGEGHGGHGRGGGQKVAG